MAWFSASGDIVKAVKEWPASYFLAFTFVAGVLLVLVATPWAPALGLRDAPPWFRLALTVAALSSLAVGAVKGGTYLQQRRAARMAAEAARKAFEKEMRNLTPWECRAIAQFVDNDSRTASFTMMDPGDPMTDTAVGLLARNYLVRVAEHRNLWFQTFTFQIQEPVFAFFKQNPELLQKGREITSEQATPEEETRKGDSV